MPTERHCLIRNNVSTDSSALGDASCQIVLVFPLGCNQANCVCSLIRGRKAIVSSSSSSMYRSSGRPSGGKEFNKRLIHSACKAHILDCKESISELMLLVRMTMFLIDQRRHRRSNGNVYEQAPVENNCSFMFGVSCSCSLKTSKRLQMHCSVS